MKKFLDSGEWYPCYSLGDGFGIEVEVDDAFFERYKRVMAEFNEMQKALRAMEKAAEAEPPEL